jgi:hypothetical protein
MDQAIVAVPRGILDSASGQWIKHVRLRRLVGHDERLLGEISDMPPHMRVLAFLERVASFKEGESATLLRKLSIGDRVALMLHVRRLELGDNLDCTVCCPNCGNAMSIVLSVPKLLDMTHPAPCADYSLVAGGFYLQVKPLTAQDQDLILNAKEGDDDDDHVIQRMARSCILNSDIPLPEKLSNEVIDALGKRLEQIDPLSDIMLDFSCLECTDKLHISFNVEDFILQELGISRRDIESEVHWLALHYHWSENEILSLPMQRRRKYISLINFAIAGEGT